MIKDEMQYIVYNGIKYECPYVCFSNPIQKKWAFIVAGVGSEIYHSRESKIIYLDTEMSVTFTDRRAVTNWYLKMQGHNNETYIEAWV